MAGVLNLNKNDILDLTKKNPSLNNIVLAGGWDIMKKISFFRPAEDCDIDLVAILLDSKGKMLGNSALIYYGNQRGTGIFLHGDNRTGAGDGDDEKISISLNNVPQNCHKIVFAATIYEADSKKQTFSKVKNAYVRLMNADKGNEEICRFNLTDEGGENTTIIFAELYREGTDWEFKAVGNLLRASISSLKNMYN
ncbi:MAG: TerD family protein [Cellulosilyticaceae bacterium]